MTKEQEKAIERCEQLIKPEHANWIGISNQKAIQTVLNIIKEKDKEIEYQKDINKTEKERHKQTEKSLKGQIIKKDEIIEKLEKEAQGYFETTIIQSEQFDKEIKKKDKIIHEMISSFIDLGFGFEYCNNDDRCINDCDKCIEQYFERKATNDGQ